ncbi:AI-2E family transporter [Miniphocaeibacter massiliensis]|uniref:AI-2E family transporter n=1 Tax=Miniphocaeibacter massiliensis TaxID=2041841 RepID=UPI000C080C20|nr:AI-2E family transporter [Miniphocaeibacter massiliensis]
MPFDVRETLINVILILLVVFISLTIYYLINIGNKNISLRNRLRFEQSFIKRTAVYVFLILIVLYLFTKHAILGSTIVTILISIVLAYLINPLVKKLEARGIKRAYAILIVYLLVILIFALMITIIMPEITEQLFNFIRNAPTILNDLSNSVIEFVEDNFSDNEKLNNFTEEIERMIGKAISNIRVKLPETAAKFGEKISGLASSLIRIVLIPIISFYLLLDKEKYIEGAKNLIPKKDRDNYLILFKDIDRVNSQFIRGRLLMALAVGVLTAIFLLIMGIEYALVIGVITCIADIIPYIGPFLGFTPAVIIAFIDNPIKAVIVGVAFVFIQWLENNILAPKILGTTIGLNPLLILLSLVVGAGMFGVVGMIFSVPVVATMKVVLQHFKDDIKNFFLNTNNIEDEENKNK